LLGFSADELDAGLLQRCHYVCQRLCSRRWDAFVLLHPLNRLERYAASLSEFTSRPCEEAPRRADLTSSDQRAPLDCAT
jgi:hypothetical protein